MFLKIAATTFKAGNLLNFFLHFEVSEAQFFINLFSSKNPENLPIKTSCQILISNTFVEEPSERVEMIYVVNILREIVSKSDCFILMKLLDFKRKFNNFTDSKNVRIS